MPSIVERAPVEVTWHSFDLLSGRRGPQLTVASTPSLSRIIGEATTAQLSVLMWDEETQTATPWEAATLQGRTMLVAIDQNDKPIWGGMVVARQSSAGIWASVSLATLEAYFDRRYLFDFTFTDEPQGEIMEALVDYEVVSFGFVMTVDCNSSTPRTIEFKSDEDKTLLSALQDLMGLEDGPEFTVEIGWTDDTHTVLERVFRARTVLGTTPEAPAQFELPGPVTEFDFVEDFSAENGANLVQAISSGEGDTRPESDYAFASDQTDNGWAYFEHRFTPTTSLTDIDTLNSYARAELAQMQDGLKELTLKSHLDNGPRVNEDFYLGDYVNVVLTCPRFPAKADPNGGIGAGYNALVRCIGWEIDLEARTLQPRLLEVG